MADREKLASEKFNCSARERAIFEAGIKMGTIYHQFVGAPVNSESVSKFESAIEETIMVQPYVKSVKVRIDRSVFPVSEDEYSYVSLTGNMIDAVVVIEIDGVAVTSEMRYDEKLGYPLMFVSKIK